MESFGVVYPVVLLRLHQSQDEILVVAQDCKSAGAAFEQALKPEEPLEECGETKYVRGGEIEML